jgi:nucleoside-diphosphate-sugar epimerase
MNIFVTGGTGFLGRKLIPRLVKEGHPVKALSRSEASDQVILKLGAVPARGSLENISQWEESLKGSDILIHCAAPVEFWGEWKKFYREITMATRNLLESSAGMGIKRFIYISSESVLQARKPLLEIDENYSYPKEPNSYYGKAKKMAELAILSHRSAMETLIIRPTFIWGKDCPAIETIEKKIKTGRFLWLDKGKCIIETVHVDNVVEAITLACTRGSDKSIYFVTDDNLVTVRDFFTGIMETRGISIPEKSVPNFVVKGMATSTEFIWKVFRRKNPPPLSRFDWAFVGMPRKYNIAKIQIELGYRPVKSMEDGLKELAGDNTKKLAAF